MYEHIDKREPAGMVHPYKSPLSVQNRLYCLLIVRINQYDCFAEMLKSINDALVVCLQTVHRTICFDQSSLTVCLRISSYLFISSAARLSPRRA